MEKGIHVKLEIFEIRMGAYVGVERRLQSLIRGDTNKVENKDFGWHTDIESACAEVAAAKELGIYWDGSVNTFKLPDVGELQIKHTQHKDGSLIIRRSYDPNFLYLLVTGTHPHYILQGFLRGKNAMKDEYLRNPLKTDRGEAFFVPQGALVDVNELKVYYAKLGKPYNRPPSTNKES